MPLKELDVRYTRRRQRPFKLSDGEGLHLLVKPNGSKLWRLKYQARQVRDRRFTLSPHRRLGRVVWHDQRRRPPRAARTCARKWGSSLAPTARCGWRGGGGVHWGGQSPAAGRIHAAIRAEGSFGAGEGRAGFRRPRSCRFQRTAMARSSSRSVCTAYPWAPKGWARSESSGSRPAIANATFNTTGVREAPVTLDKLIPLFDQA